MTKKNTSKLEASLTQESEAITALATLVELNIINNEEVPVIRQRIARTLGHDSTDQVHEFSQETLIDICNELFEMGLSVTSLANQSGIQRTHLSRVLNREEGRNLSIQQATDLIEVLKKINPSIAFRIG